jgi:hypothetical protein
VELEQENERLLNETAKLESDVARWEAACERAETTYYGEHTMEIVETYVNIQPVQQVQVSFTFDPSGNISWGDQP